MKSFYDRGRGRTLVPRERFERNEPGKVISYQLSEAELAKYRALPKAEGKAPMTMPRRRKKA